MKVNDLSNIISQYDAARGFFKTLFTSRHPAICNAIDIRNEAIQNGAEDLSDEQELALFGCFARYSVREDDALYTALLACITRNKIRNLDNSIASTAPHSIIPVLYQLHNINLLLEYAALVRNHIDAQSIAKIFKILHQKHLLTTENIATTLQYQHIWHIKESLSNGYLQENLTQEILDAVFNYPKDIAYILIELRRKHLPPESRALVIQSQNPKDTKNAFIALNEAHLLTLENQEAVAQHTFPSSLARAFIRLHEISLLSSYREFIIASNSPDVLARALQSLQKEGMLQTMDSVEMEPHHAAVDLENTRIRLHNIQQCSTEDRNILKSKNNPESVAKAFVVLDKARLLTAENKDLVNALIRLQKANMFTKQNREAALAHRNPDSLVRALIHLNNAYMLTPEYRHVIQSHPLPKRMASALTLLQAARIDIETLPLSLFQHIVNSSSPIASAKTLIFFYRYDVKIDEEKERIIQDGKTASYFNVVYSGLTKALSPRALELAYLVTKPDYRQPILPPHNPISFQNTAMYYLNISYIAKCGTNNSLWMEGIGSEFFFNYLDRFLLPTPLSIVIRQIYQTFIYQAITKRAERCYSERTFRQLLSKLEDKNILSSPQNRAENLYQLSYRQEETLRNLYHSAEHQKRLPALYAKLALIEYETACFAEQAVNQPGFENEGVAEPCLLVNQTLTAFITQETRLTALRLRFFQDQNEGKQGAWAPAVTNSMLL